MGLENVALGDTEAMVKTRPLLRSRHSETMGDERPLPLIDIRPEDE